MCEGSGGNSQLGTRPRLEIIKLSSFSAKSSASMSLITPLSPLPYSHKPTSHTHTDTRSLTQMQAHLKETGMFEGRWQKCTNTQVCGSWGGCALCRVQGPVARWASSRTHAPILSHSLKGTGEGRSGCA